METMTLILSNTFILLSERETPDRRGLNSSQITTDLITLGRLQLLWTSHHCLRTTPAGGRLIHGRSNVYQAHKYGGFSAESGFQPEAPGSEAETLPQGHRGRSLSVKLFKTDSTTLYHLTF
ncbi:hypothetical protein AVEN_118337-1 [Araneus ventricosus]|uniref:Uncharacterized protein n=1 Tax=Araneus ventricosus TaxID=182803 RepID=A0A4Y2B5A3_ARAVE|nr:hypothetical protein AVEN_118337-1 [Araneus ventricosus]